MRVRVRVYVCARMSGVGEHLPLGARASLRGGSSGVGIGSDGGGVCNARARIAD